MIKTAYVIREDNKIIRKANKIEIEFDKHHPGELFYTYEDDLFLRVVWIEPTE